MFSNILAQHVPYIPGFGSETAGPVPSPPPSPAPPPEERIAFSASVKPCLWVTTGSAIGSTTLATITCAETLTATFNQTFAGLTLSYSSATLTISGTASGTTGVYRLVVTYTNSSGVVRGSTEHEITVRSASETLTIGTMTSVAGKVGKALSVAILSPSANYPTELIAKPQTAVPGLTATLAWTVGASTASGTLTLAGTPTEAGTFTLTVDYSGRGMELGTSTHTVVIGESSATIPSAPAAAPGPPAPSPAPAPACTPAPAPPSGPDSDLTNTRVLMRFDAQDAATTAAQAVALATDERGNTFAVVTMSGGALGVTAGAVNGGALFADGGRITGTVAALDNSDGEYESLTVECMVDVTSTSTLWSAAPSSLRYFVPVVSAMSSAGDAGGSVVWSLGLLSVGIGPAPGVYTGRQVYPCFMVQTENTTLTHEGVTYRAYTQAALGDPLNSRPGRYIHLAGMLKTGTPAKLAAWADGASPYAGTCATFTGRLLRDVPTVHIGTIPGGVIPKNLIGPDGVPFRIAGLLPPRFALDELRIKTSAQYGSYITGTNAQADIPATARVIPWPNY